ncbi:alpha-ketoglutarate dehydrogenase [Bradyrhizobium guangdongense]|uniref:Pyruvate dehydrogenase E1 component n=1 Tax=Bradyrhizobium guangdongense TaxID=1325090 RepID=A0A410V4H1_9BRAD|nr:alpha-ketoglutarate dehydrogenase [Bradyrhizobium guangdongense]QAU38564.1 pyruvate dehydrogenase (acetyl-transferring), homodimeric type [Bradyrhizobium guangdongense]QOZ59626.1 pyruvate dehydrogenase (acetyl-transferring), homodimeric type [Bradyrhizobium guangdongense]GGI33363.1 pyruvate dehydrogenase E1 component [Bradyrhizobium guangdongense]
MTAHIDPPRKAITDQDTIETADWLASLGSLHRSAGAERVRYILAALDRRAKELGVLPDSPPFSPYRNSIPLEQQRPYPGDIAIETRLTAIIRWNALAMVVRANKAYGELGGHVASYASAAEIFEVGFNHFFRASSSESEGDLVYFQPHSSPGVYARAYLEGRLSDENLKLYRQELSGPGLSSYPHPWLMPEFWQVPSASMGLGPISAIYQARFMKYLQHRGLVQTAGRHVWGVFGDGEMDEPESIAGLALAARENLDNLTFVVNCNLQRLDGPVRGNGQVIQELESLFRGAGWNVIKVLWGSDWDDIFARDSNHALLRKFADTVDGKYQTLGAKDGAYNLANFFSEDPEVRALVAHMSDVDIDGLKRGGHDFKKLFAAFAAATDTKGRPTVILAKTKKGYGMGGAGESRMTSHQAKKLDVDALYAFRDRFALPLSNEQVENLEFFRPAEDSAEIQYLRARRAALGGYMPARRRASAELPVPPLQSYAEFALRGDGKETSTTMAIARLFTNLLKDKTLGPRIVPIVADEARTFGMANLFRQVGIYSPAGQLYEPEDAGSMLYYKEAIDGQLLEEGITEAGAISSWTAAATSYSTHNFPLLPFYIYYSMFGFQRVGDLIWAAADQRARGFLIGATAGRTTLGGEGLQHQDGSSHLMAATVPNCRAYDPAFSYEVAVIVDHGMRSMLEQGNDEFYYLTAMNENYAQPSMPDDAREGIIKGLYRVLPSADGPGKIRLVGSGAILPEALAAAAMLQSEWKVPSEVWSATSFSELAREAREVERTNRLSPLSTPVESHVAQCLGGKVPIVAASDYVRAYPQLIGSYIEAPYTVLGTDGFGRSDTRAALRSFFEVDRKQIVVAALSALAKLGEVAREQVAEAIASYELPTGVASPWSR